MLVELGVDALGVNFWPGSRRYVDPDTCGWLAESAGVILRVGVFVNAEEMLPMRLFRGGVIDVVQLHGDETPEQVRVFRDAGVPVLKALGVAADGPAANPVSYDADGVLLDVHAPGVYGGTGHAFDWEKLRVFRGDHPSTPVILAGGIVPENAAAAAAFGPSALDVASGVEFSPGIKDPDKVASLLKALRNGER
jgi:phosphoribosylanthranilate isomerase